MGASDVQIRIIGKDVNATGTLRSVDQAAANTTAQINTLGRATSGLNQVFTSAAGFAAGIAGFNGLSAAIQGTVGAVFNFKKGMEVHETGMAGILLSMTEINGRTLTWGESIGLSKTIMAQLNSEALRTAATTEELTGAFRGILGPALNAKMTISEIVQLSSAGVNAVKSIMPNNADVQRQIIQELRDLVAGGIQPSSSTLATALGLKDADIKAAKESSEGLFKFLMDRLKGFETSAPAYARTWNGITDQIKEGVTLGGSQGFDPLFAAMKTELADVAAQVVIFNKETGKMEVNPEITKTFREIGDTVLVVGREVKALASDISTIAAPAAAILGGALKIAAGNAESLTIAIGGWLALRRVGVIYADVSAAAAGATTAQTFLGRAVVDTQAKFAQQAAAAITATQETTAVTTAASAVREKTIVNAERLAMAAVIKTEKQVMASAVAAAQATGASAAEINAIIQSSSAKAALAAERAALATREAILSTAQAATVATGALAEQGIVATVAGSKAATAAGSAALVQKELATSIGITTAAQVESGVAAQTAGVKTVGAMAVGRTAAGNFLSSLWALAGGWAGVAIAIGYATYKLYEHFDTKNKIDSYNPKAKVFEENGKLYKEAWTEKPITTVDEMGNTIETSGAGWGKVEFTPGEYEDHYAWKKWREEQENQKPWQSPDGSNIEELMKQLTAKYPGTDDGKAAKAAERAYEEKQRLLDKLADMTAKMNTKMVEDTSTAYEANTAKLTAEVENMKRELDKSSIDFKKYGLDVTAVYSQIGKYQDSMKAKIERQRSQEMAGMKADTVLIATGIGGDPKQQAEAEYQKELTRIRKERQNDELFKKTAKGPDDAEARAAADDNYAKQEAAALKARNDKYRDADLQYFDRAVQHNQNLKLIAGETSDAIDRMNRRVLDNKISFLQQELNAARITVEKRQELEDKLATAIEQRNQIASRNMYESVGLAINDIRNEQFEWANLYKSTWSDIDSSVNDHFKNMLKGNEGLIRGIKGGLVDVAQSVTDMMADILYQTYIMQPVKDWFTDLLGSMGASGSKGSASASTTSSNFNAGKWLTSISSGMKFNAVGGYNSGGWTVVGEEGPELVNFANPSRVYTAQQTRQALNGREGGGNGNVTMVFPGVTKPQEVSQFRYSRRSIARQGFGLAQRGAR